MEEKALNIAIMLVAGAKGDTCVALRIADQSDRIVSSVFLTGADAVLLAKSLKEAGNQAQSGLVLANNVPKRVTTQA